MRMSGYLVGALVVFVVLAGVAACIPPREVVADAVPREVVPLTANYTVMGGCVVTVCWFEGAPTACYQVRTGQYLSRVRVVEVPPGEHPVTVVKRDQLARLQDAANRV